MPALAASMGMWVGVSTGYESQVCCIKSGVINFGRNTVDVLFVQGASLSSIVSRPSIIERAKAEDPKRPKPNGWVVSE